jgi:transposase
MLATLATQFLLLPADMQVEEVVLDKNLLMLVLSSTQLTATCPYCSCLSARVHSHYTRTLVDLPCQERAVVLRVQVRRFFCLAAECAHQTFAEQFPALAPAYARRTHRQLQRLCQIAFALGGRPGARLVKQQAMPTSFSTLLRLLRHSPAPFVPSPHVLGIDDFALKKGDCYGTILVDLERHRPIDLLPDREAATVMAWLKAHPEIDLVSRDRASVYGQAVKKGAPQAIQVADRYHLLVNLRDHLKSFLDHKRTSLPKVEVERPDGQVEDQQESPDAQREALAALMKPLLAKQEPEPARDASLASFVRDTTREKWFYTPSRPALARSQASRTRRFARFEEVRALHQQGLSMRTIARELGMSRARVSTFIQAETFPEQAPRPRKGAVSKLDPFVPYILRRWQEGEYNGAQLYQEIRDQGFTGSRPLVRRLIADLRRMHPPAPGTRRSWVRKVRPVIDDPTFSKLSPPPQPKRKRLTPSQVAWLFVCHPQKLTQRQRKQLEIVCQAGVDFQHVYALAQDFVTMLTQQQAEVFEGWLQRAEQSGIASLKGLAKGLRRDYAAVAAALTLPWSQGQVEGQITRLKLLKRQMYGRAKFDLLRLQVLHAA